MLLIMLGLFLCSSRCDCQKDHLLHSLLTPSSAELTLCDQLLHPMGLSAFLNDHFEKEPFLLRRGADFLHGLLSADDLDELLLAAFGTTPSGEELTSEATVLEGQGLRWKIVRRAFRAGAWRVVSFRNASMTLGQVHDLFLRGFSLVINRLQLHSTSVRWVTDSLTQCLGLRVSANVYFTPPNSTAFEAHIDWMDGLVVQLQGVKRWRIWSPPLISLPRPDLVYSPYNGSDVVSSLSYEIIQLQPGDLLYIPRGLTHEVSTAGSTFPSLHITFGLETATHFTPQILLHHALRLFFATLAALPTGIIFHDDALKQRIEVPKEQVGHLLHLYLHCAAGSNDRLRRALRVSHVVGVPDPDIAGLSKESRELVMRYGFDRLMRCALHEDLLEVYFRSGWILLRQESLQRFEKPSTAYISRFLEAPRCTVIIDVHPSDMVNWIYDPNVLSSVFSAGAWKSASDHLGDVWSEASELSKDSWESFLNDAKHHMGNSDY